MKQNAFWEQFSIGCYQLWIWLKYEASAHPFLAVGVVVVVIFAWAMYKTEVRAR